MIQQDGRPDRLALCADARRLAGDRSRSRRRARRRRDLPGPLQGQGRVLQSARQAPGCITPSSGRRSISAARQIRSTARSTGSPTTARCRSSPTTQDSWVYTKYPSLYLSAAMMHAYLHAVGEEQNAANAKQLAEDQIQKLNAAHLGAKASGSRVTMPRHRSFG